ncbi:MAG: peptidogalycan biosysnthesis protein, partial [Pseudomonadota bacterium]
MSIQVEFLTSLSKIDATDWNAITGEDYPFGRHEFLYGLEQTGCANAETGWQPCHLILKDTQGIMAVMPLYLKSHSYGEYVFDWSWADAWRRSGLEYYPKLLTAIPFTPATGPRLFTRKEVNSTEMWRIALDAIRHLAGKQSISSWHVLFPDEEIASGLLSQGLHRRSATQFHWFNEGYQSFDDFLDGFTSRKRKGLRRERTRVAQQGLDLITLQGNEISPHDWLQFHRFYQMTYAKRSGHGGYLSREFFTETAATLG